MHPPPGPLRLEQAGGPMRRGRPKLLHAAPVGREHWHHATSELLLMGRSPGGEHPLLPQPCACPQAESHNLDPENAPPGQKHGKRPSKRTGNICPVIRPKSLLSLNQTIAPQSCLHFSKANNSLSTPPLRDLQFKTLSSQSSK